jgi:hypothetical protein
MQYSQQINRIDGIPCNEPKFLAQVIQCSARLRLFFRAFAVVMRVTCPCFFEIFSLGRFELLPVWDVMSSPCRSVTLKRFQSAKSKRNH